MDVISAAAAARGFVVGGSPNINSSSSSTTTNNNSSATSSSSSLQKRWEEAAAACDGTLEAVRGRLTSLRQHLATMRAQEAVLTEAMAMPPLTGWHPLQSSSHPAAGGVVNANRGATTSSTVAANGTARGGTPGDVLEWDFDTPQQATPATVAPPPRPLAATEGGDEGKGQPAASGSTCAATNANGVASLLCAEQPQRCAEEMGEEEVEEPSWRLWSQPTPTPSQPSSLSQHQGPRHSSTATGPARGGGRSISTRGLLVGDNNDGNNERLAAGAYRRHRHGPAGPPPAAGGTGSFDATNTQNISTTTSSTNSAKATRRWVDPFADAFLVPHHSSRGGGGGCSGDDASGSGSSSNSRSHSRARLRLVQAAPPRTAEARVLWAVESVLPSPYARFTAWTDALDGQLAAAALAAIQRQHHEQQHQKEHCNEQLPRDAVQDAVQDAGCDGGGHGLPALSMSAWDVVAAHLRHATATATSSTVPPNSSSTAGPPLASIPIDAAVGLPCSCYSSLRQQEQPEQAQTEQSGADDGSVLCSCAGAPSALFGPSAAACRSRWEQVLLPMAARVAAAARSRLDGSSSALMQSMVMTGGGMECVDAAAFDRKAATNNTEINSKAIHKGDYGKGFLSSGSGGAAACDGTSLLRLPSAASFLSAADAQWPLAHDQLLWALAERQRNDDDDTITSKIREDGGASSVGGGFRVGRAFWSLAVSPAAASGPLLGTHSPFAALCRFQRVLNPLHVVAEASAAGPLAAARRRTLAAHILASCPDHYPYAHNYKKHGAVVPPAHCASVRRGRGKDKGRQPQSAPPQEQPQPQAAADGPLLLSLPHHPAIAEPAGKRPRGRQGAAWSAAETALLRWLSTAHSDLNAIFAAYTAACYFHATIATAVVRGTAAVAAHADAADPAACDDSSSSTNSSERSSGSGSGGGGAWPASYQPFIEAALHSSVVGAARTEAPTPTPSATTTHRSPHSPPSLLVLAAPAQIMLRTREQLRLKIKSLRRQQQQQLEQQAQQHQRSRRAEPTKQGSARAVCDTSMARDPTAAAAVTEDDTEEEYKDKVDEYEEDGQSSD